MAGKQIGGLAGRLAVVTGGGGGIGRAICQRFAREGASVVVADINRDVAKETAASLPSIEGAPSRHSHFELDVTSQEQVVHLMDKINTDYQRYPCISVNCHGITRDDFIVKMSEDTFNEVINVNLKGTFLMIQAAARGMIKSKVVDGSIVNIGSISAKVGNLGQVNYVASKAAIEGMTRTCAKELAIYGVRCNVILPGFIQTAMLSTVPSKLINKVIVTL